MRLSVHRVAVAFRRPTCHSVRTGLSICNSTRVCSCRPRCESNRQFLAAFQRFEAMNVDGEVGDGGGGGGGGFGVRPVSRLFGKKGEGPEPQQQHRSSYQVGFVRRSKRVSGGGLCCACLLFRLSMVLMTFPRSISGTPLLGAVHS